MTEVLEVIGLIVLCLLILLIVAILIIGWTPFRYRLELKAGTEREQKLDADLVCWWAGPLVRVIADVTESGYRAYGKFLWIYLFDTAKPMTDSANRFARYVLTKIGLYEEEIPDGETNMSSAEQAAGSAEASDEPELKGMDAAKAGKAVNTEENARRQQIKSRRESAEKKESCSQEASQPKEKTGLEAWKEVFFTKYEKIRLQIKNICDKIKKATGFVKKLYEISEQTFVREFIRNLFRHLWRMFCYVIPYSVRGRAAFGIKDQPEAMGTILMWLGIFYPMYGKTVQIEPTFEYSMADVDLLIKGRVRIYRVVYYVLRIVIHPSTFKVIDYIRKQEVL